MTLMSKIASFLALCLLLTSIAGAQSLADLAKKERERREKNKNDGLAVREFSEDQIFEEEEEEEEDSGESDERGIEGPSLSGDADNDPDSDSSRTSSPIPDRIDIPIGEDVDDGELEDESREREQQEAKWRNRFAEARERVTYAREQKAIWDGVHYVEGIKLVDENGNVIVESLDDLRRLVAQAGQELSEAQRALKALEEEARRAGVPPGWLR